MFSSNGWITGLLKIAKIYIGQKRFQWLNSTNTFNTSSLFDIQLIFFNILYGLAVERTIV